MATSRVKTNLFLTFEIGAKWQYVCYTQRSYRLISLNQPITGTGRSSWIFYLSIDKVRPPINISSSNFAQHWERIPLYINFNPLKRTSKRITNERVKHNLNLCNGAECFLTSRINQEVGGGPKYGN